MTPRIVPHEKRCSKCGLTKPAQDFMPRADSKDGLRGACRMCMSIQNGHTPKALMPQYNAPEGHYYCVDCKTYKPFEAFTVDRHSKKGRRSVCRDCAHKRSGWKTRRIVPYEPDGHKYCSTCKQIKPYHLFNKHPKHRYGLQPVCKLCSYDYRVKFKAGGYYHSKDKEAQKRTGKVKLLRITIPDTTLTAAEWHTCLDYFNHRCAVCERPAGLWHKIAIDHWIPLSTGGSTDRFNIVPLCHGLGGCNNYKRNTPAAQWLETTYGKEKAQEILARIQGYFDSLA